VKRKAALEAAWEFRRANQDGQIKTGGMMDAPPHVLPDVIKPGLRIVFCGTAAGTVSAARGAYYAHPQNRIWSALLAFELTPRKLRPEDYAELWQWGLGLTDIAKHVSGMDRELPPGALGRTACAALEAKIVAAEPEWLAFTSLNAGRRYLGRAAGFGEQSERIGRTRLWLLPSPSPTAGWNWEINAHWWRMLADEARSAEPVVIPARAGRSARDRVFGEIAKQKQVKPS
jgi:double-stranded uracil-DNA glycosylase